MDGKLSSCYEAVDYILETYAMDVIIAEIDADMMKFTPLLNKLPIAYPKSIMEQCTFMRQSV